MSRRPAMLRVEVTFLRTVDAGRSTPVDLSRYRTTVAVGHHADLESASATRDGLFTVAFLDGPLVSPGSSGTSLLAAIVDWGLHAIAEAGVFTVFEPPRVVAHGRVLESL